MQTIIILNILQSSLHQNLWGIFIMQKMSYSTGAESGCEYDTGKENLIKCVWIWMDRVMNCLRVNIMRVFRVRSELFVLCSVGIGVDVISAVSVFFFSFHYFTTQLKELHKLAIPIFTIFMLYFFR